MGSEGWFMTFLQRVLEPPSYGFERDGALYVPGQREILREFFRRLNFLADRKNWLAFFGWATTLSFAVPLWLFFRYHFNFWLLALGFFYSMVFLGSHGTFWLHRYCTHRAFQIRNPFCLALLRNLAIKIVPEETYVVSHHVHHQFPERPGDPYNSRAGWLYCFLADVNHQPIRRDLDEKEYAQLRKLMSHTGVRVNSYAQYRRWGSLCHPAFAIGHYALNWGFWYGIFYLLGGNALAVALFGSAGVWAVGVRTFNYEGHGRGRDRRRDGIDFNRRDLSVNQLWPGFVAGEWHNNHHLYPNGARSGLLPYQVDLPWYAIRSLAAIGVISRYKDFKSEFLRDHYRPYRASVERARADAALVPRPRGG